MAGNGPLTIYECEECGGASDVPPGAIGDAVCAGSVFGESAHEPMAMTVVRVWRDEDVRPLYAALGDLIDRRNDYPTSLDPAPAYGRAHADAARLRAAFPAPPEWKDPSDGA